VIVSSSAVAPSIVRDEWSRWLHGFDDRGAGYGDTMPVERFAGVCTVTFVAPRHRGVNLGVPWSDDDHGGELCCQQRLSAATFPA
jgi:hypothetical protein